MSIIEFRSSKDPELVESLVLDLCDPQEKANALSELPQGNLYSPLYRLFHHLLFI